MYLRTVQCSIQLKFLQDLNLLQNKGHVEWGGQTWNHTLKNNRDLEFQFENQSNKLVGRRKFQILEKKPADKAKDFVFVLRSSRLMLE
jgi:hypothetical protein